VGNIYTSIGIFRVCCSKHSIEGLTLSDRVLKAVEYLLYPLARLVIARGIGYGALSDVIKFVMVKEAERQLKQKSAETISDSRLSVITGIHRKEIKRIRSLKANDASSYELSLASQVVSKWAAEKRLRSKAGIKPLPRKKVCDEDIDFDDLVRSISTDVRPRAVLEELLDRGLVTVVEEDNLQLHPENLALKQDQEETLRYLSLTIHDHLTTSVNNLLNPESKLFDRCVHYHGLNADAVNRLRSLAETKAMETIIEVNEKAQELIKDPRNKGKSRMNFGSYFFAEKQGND
jgi:hypothetical protein